MATQKKRFRQRLAAFRTKPPKLVWTVLALAMVLLLLQAWRLSRHADSPYLTYIPFTGRLFDIAGSGREVDSVALLPPYGTAPIYVDEAGEAMAVSLLDGFRYRFWLPAPGGIAGGEHSSIVVLFTDGTATQCEITPRGITRDGVIYFGPSDYFAPLHDYMRFLADTGESVPLEERSFPGETPETAT